MANTDLGEKHICPECGSRFYDLGKLPPTCPKCKTVVVGKPEAAKPKRAAAKPKPAPAKKAAAAAAELVTDEE